MESLGSVSRDIWNSIDRYADTLGPGTGLIFFFTGLVAFGLYFKK